MDEIPHFGYKQRVPINLFKLKIIIKIINSNFEKKLALLLGMNKASGAWTVTSQGPIAGYRTLCTRRPSPLRKLTRGAVREAL